MYEQSKTKDKVQDREAEHDEDPLFVHVTFYWVGRTRKK